MASSAALTEFRNDMERVSRILDLIGRLQEISAHAPPAIPADLGSILQPNFYSDLEEYIVKSEAFRGRAADCLSDYVIMGGTIVLYMAGRFEYFFRTRFEDLCDDVATKCKEYGKLPKTMRENLIALTGQVIQSPRKYQHGDGGVKSFVKILSDNLQGVEPFGGINSQCLSITNENLRSEIVEEVLKRVGIGDFWTRISQQSGIMTLCETTNGEQCKNEIKKRLDCIMWLRNSVAHPSGNQTWPDLNAVRLHAGTLAALAEEIDKIFDLYARELSSRSAGS